MSDHTTITERISALPSVLAKDYDGELWITRYFDDDLTEMYPKFHIKQADPKIRIRAGLIDDIRRGPHHPDIDLDGDILRIHGTNQTVVYRLVTLDRMLDCYLAEWPD